ncbi:MAG: heavy-metal-associated domain-containing protein [Clostridiales bacterium]|nr:heavy-metal-associated domain-containing protein [Clostridiales bacterium]
MRRSFKLEDLDCANCAAKMEEAIGKLPGVTKVSVNFMAQKMILEADDAVFESVLKEAAKTIAQVEPDCRIIM